MGHLAWPPFDRFGVVDVLSVAWLTGALVCVTYAAFAARVVGRETPGLRREWIVAVLAIGPVGFVLYVLWHTLLASTHVRVPAAVAVGLVIVIWTARRVAPGTGPATPGWRRQLCTRRWVSRTVDWTARLSAVALGATILIAYTWQPPEDSQYDSSYLAEVDTDYVGTPIARFHYVRSGEGPPVVLVPGGTLWLYSYRDLIAALSTSFTVYAVDMPGQGYTDDVPGDFDYDLESMSDALGTFMSAVGLEQASVVGHSWGGAISIAFAQRHPARVTKLGLLASPGLDDPSTAIFEAMEIPLVGEVIGKLMDRSTFEDGLRDMFVHQARLTEEDVDEYWVPLTRRANRAAMWLEQRSFDYSLTEQSLSDIDTPTMVLWGDQDGIVEPWQAHELGRRIPDAQVEMLPGCGHIVHEDCPTRTIRELRTFLAAQ